MLSLFFVPEISSRTTITVTGDEAHHALKVMRLHVGDEISLADGNGNWAVGKILVSDKNSFDLQVTSSGFQTPKSPQLVVIQALTKSDRTKETIELLTAAGVDVIIPWAADRSISQWQEDHQVKWRTAALAASKQSRRFRIPEIEALFTFSRLDNLLTKKTLVLVFHESATRKLSDIANELKIAQSGNLESLESIVIVIGPEGGISPAELSKFELSGAVIVHLGEPVFRSAHAGIAALSAIQALIGRW
jgi:16S rRNA (uracil1498-N3)-methyltransferase